MGKSFIAQALGYAAVRAGHTVRFVHADDFFRAMAQARVDHSTDKTFRSFIAPDLLILDDLGLHRMTQHQSIDLYELVIARHRTASFVITSNRAVDEWLGLFDDPILGNSALDRLANASYQIVIEGASYRERLSRTGRCSTERRWLTLKPNGDNSPSTGPQGGSMTLAIDNSHHWLRYSWVEGQGEDLALSRFGRTDPDRDDVEIVELLVLHRRGVGP